MRCFLLPHLFKREIRTEVTRYPYSLLNNFCVKVHWQENPSCVCMAVYVCNCATGRVCFVSLGLIVPDSHEASEAPGSVCSSCFQVINLTFFCLTGCRGKSEDGSFPWVVPGHQL